MSGPGDATAPDRRVGELAALVSAITAVVGLLLALFGVPFVGGSPVNRSVAAPVDSPATATATATATAAWSASAVPTNSGSPGASGEPGTAPAASAPSPSPDVPEGWRRVGEPALTVVFAVPDGWVRRPAGAIQSTWRSPDGTHEMSVKRDTSYGATPREASVGQLAWYRDTAASSMAGLKAVTHTTRQNGKDALWLEIDYHWAGQTEPRKRVEVFVAGSAGHVYQMLFDTAAGPGNLNLATQRGLFATARAHLLIDRNAP
ncbi:hypothetical protein [Streptomyces bobili]|uniref:hypothetical protein n=1 Tax=Streptomyces bobili TaxID=67280 RepID=UPI00142DEAB1|nr:hypothetical protein [Streptomyces bobili]